MSIEYITLNNGEQSADNLKIKENTSVWNTSNNSSSIEDDAFLIKQDNAIYSRVGIFNHIFYVKDSLHNMKWIIGNESKEILKLKCYSVSTSFRGRNYTAFYTTDISPSNGPWKFGGLPGLILEIKSDDNMIQYTATKIINNYVGNFEIEDIKRYKFINWTSYASKFIETVDKYVKQIRSDGSIQPGSTVKIKIDAPEIIYPKAQQGEGIIIEQ